MKRKVITFQIESWQMWMFFGISIFILLVQFYPQINVAYDNWQHKEYDSTFFWGNGSFEFQSYLAVTPICIIDNYSNKSFCWEQNQTEEVIDYLNNKKIILNKQDCKNKWCALG